MIRAYIDELHDIVISASEDGFVYLWNKLNQENNNKKNYYYEFFKPFEKDTPCCSFFANDQCTANYLKKVFTLTTKIMINSIIVNVTLGGRLQVLLNCEELESA